MNAHVPERIQPGRGDDLPPLRIRFTSARDNRRVGEWLRGTTPEEAVTRAGTVYAICRRAQQAATRLATHAADGACRACDATHAPPVLAEWLREHACNLMLSWPKLLHQPGEPALPRALLQVGGPAWALPDALAPCLRDEVLGMPPDAFLALDASGLDRWCTSAETATAARFRDWRGGPFRLDDPPPLLPDTTAWDDTMAATLAAHMRGEPDFCLQPCWHGRTVETGAFTRQRAHPLLRAWLRLSGNDPAARMLARLIELATAAAGRPVGNALRAWSPDAGQGIAAVETARGPLLHFVQMRGGRIRDYRVLAPTEWNFHPRGLLARAAGAIDDAQRTAGLEAWVLALDPCDECTVEVGHA